MATRIAEVQWLAGARIARITGVAADGIEEVIKGGRFNAKLHAAHLSRVVGGAWILAAVPRTGMTVELCVTPLLTCGLLQSGCAALFAEKLRFSVSRPNLSAAPPQRTAVGLCPTDPCPSNPRRRRSRTATDDAKILYNSESIASPQCRRQSQIHSIDNWIRCGNVSNNLRNKPAAVPSQFYTSAAIRVNVSPALQNPGRSAGRSGHFFVGVGGVGVRWSRPEFFVGVDVVTCRCRRCRRSARRAENGCRNAQIKCRINFAEKSAGST